MPEGIQDPSQDPQFLAAPFERQHAYLMSADPGYAQAPPERQQAYLAHVNGGKPVDELGRQTNRAAAAAGVPQNPKPILPKPEPTGPATRFASGALSGAKAMLPSLESLNPLKRENIQRAVLGPVGALAEAGLGAAREYGRAREEGQPRTTSALAAATQPLGIDTAGIRERAAQGDIAGLAGEATPAVASILGAEPASRALKAAKNVVGEGIRKAPGLPLQSRVPEMTGTTPERIAQLGKVEKQVGDVHGSILKTERRAYKAASDAYPEIEGKVPTGEMDEEGNPIEVSFKEAQRRYSDLGVDARAAHRARLSGVDNGYAERDLLAKKDALGKSMKEVADAEGKLEEYNAAQKQFAKYMQDFHSQGSPIEPLLRMKGDETGKITNHLLSADRGKRTIKVLEEYNHDVAPIQKLLSRGSTPLKVDVNEAAKLRQMGEEGYRNRRLQESLDQATTNRLPGEAQARLPAWAMRSKTQIPGVPEMLNTPIPTRFLTKRAIQNAIEAAKNTRTINAAPASPGLPPAPTAPPALPPPIVPPAAPKTPPSFGGFTPPSQLPLVMSETPQAAAPEPAPKIPPSAMKATREAVNGPDMMEVHAREDRVADLQKRMQSPNETERRNAQKIYDTVYAGPERRGVEPPESATPAGNPPSAPKIPPGAMEAARAQFDAERAQGKPLTPKELKLERMAERETEKPTPARRTREPKEQIAPEIAKDTETMEQAKSEIEAMGDMWGAFERPGRYVHTEGYEPGDVKPGKPEVVVNSITGMRDSMESQFPWLKNLPKMTEGKLRAAIESGKGVEYNRLINEAGKHIQAVKAANAPVIEEFRSQLESAAEAVKDQEPDLAQTFRDILDGKYSSYRDLASYVKEKLDEAETADQFNEALSRGFEEAAESGPEPREATESPKELGILPGLEKAVHEQHLAAGKEQARQMTEKINEPPKSIESAAGEMESRSPLFRGTAASPQNEIFPPRTPDTMSEAIALSSPSGSMSGRARAAAMERLRKNLFGEKGLQKATPTPEPEYDKLIRQAKELRGLAERGMKPKAYLKQAEELERQAEKLKP